MCVYPRRTRGVKRGRVDDSSDEEEEEDEEEEDDEPDERDKDDTVEMDGFEEASPSFTLDPKPKPKQKPKLKSKTAKFAPVAAAAPHITGGGEIQNELEMVMRMMQDMKKKSQVRTLRGRRSLHFTPLHSS